MSETKTWAALVTMLVRQTREGKITWETNEHKSRLETGSMDVEIAYTTSIRTNFTSKSIYLYKYRYRDYDHLDREFWRNELELCFLTNDFRIEREIPISAAGLKEGSPAPLVDRKRIAEASSRCILKQ